MRAGLKRWWKRSHGKLTGSVAWQTRPASGQVRFDPTLQTAAQRMRDSARTVRAA